MRREFKAKGLRECSLDELDEGPAAANHVWACKTASRSVEGSSRDYTKNVFAESLAEQILGSIPRGSVGD
jgi:hypothetical protein